MKFEKVLMEAPLNLPEADLARWGKIQFLAWNQIAKARNLVKGSTEYFNGFVKFASMFDKKYRKSFEATHEFPPVLSIVHDYQEAV